MLTKSILTNISSSDLSFHKNYDEIDIVIGGGGFNGFYVLGFNKIIKKLENKGHLKVARYAGTSVGAICSVLIVCQISDDAILQLYEKIKNVKEYFINLKTHLQNILPENAYILCSNKVFISLTTFPFLQNHIVSVYNSNDELIDACMASSCMPLLITNRLYYRFKDKYYLDGFLSRNLIHFNDNAREQIIIQPHKIEYHFFNKFLPLDSSIAGLIVKGAIDAENFFTKDDFELPYMMWFRNTKKRIRPFFVFTSFFLLACSIVQLRSTYV